MRSLELRLKAHALGWQAALALALSVAVAVAGANSSTRSLAIVGALLLVMVALWTYSPQLTILGYLAMRPLADAVVYRQVGGLTVGQVWGAGLLILLLAYLFLGRADRLDRHVPRPSIPVAPLAMIVGYALLAWTRPDLFQAVVVWLRLSSWLILILVIERIAATSRGQERVVQAMAVFAVMVVLVVAYLASIGAYGEAYYSLSYDQSFASTGQSPHGLGEQATQVLPFILLFVYAGRRDVTALILAAVLVMCVVLSYVRSTYVALAFVLVGYLWLSLRARSLRLRLTAAGIALATLAVGYVQRDTILSRFETLSSTLGGARGLTAVEGTGGRNLFWSTTLDYWLASPAHFLFGGGVDASYQAIYAATGYYVWSHNDFLEMAATGGILLLLLYLALLVWLLHSTISLQRDRRQSHLARGFGFLATCSVIAFVAISFLNATALSSTGCLAFAVLIGLVRGMRATPGETVLDAFAQRRGASARPGSGGRAADVMGDASVNRRSRIPPWGRYTKTRRRLPRQSSMLDDERMATRDGEDCER